MSPERIKTLPNRPFEIFNHLDLPNHLTQIAKIRWSNPVILPVEKRAMFQDENSYIHPYAGFYIQQTTETSTGVRLDQIGHQIAAILPLEDRNSLWILSTKKPIIVKIDSKSFDRKLKSAVLKQLHHPITFISLEHGDQQQITPFEIGNFPFSTKK